ncbi:MAG: DNA polymerase I [Pirellulales bacterium]
MSSRYRQAHLPGLQPSLDASSPGSSSSPPASLAGDRPTPPEGDSETDQDEPDLKGKHVWVVDAHSLIFQVFHALPEMTSSRGESVGAVFGFVRDMLYLVEQKQPDCLLAAFDLPGKTFRHEVFDRYKIQREEMPGELVPQIAKIRHFLNTMQVPILDYPGYEADDILATVARRCREAGAYCYLVTGDKDSRQLISDQVWVYNVRKDELYGAEELARDWGVRPEQVVDFQAMVGDPVDNVPGIPLIGPKIAGQLLGQYGTLDEVLAHADQISGTKRRQNLMEGRDQARISRTLVRLEDSVPIEFDWRIGQVGYFDRQAMAELLAELGFRSLGEKLGHLPGEDAKVESWNVDYRIVNTKEKLDELVTKLKQQPAISLDTETTNIWPCWAEVVGYSFAWTPGEAYYVPVRGPDGESYLDPETVADALRPVLEDPAVKKVGQNLKYEIIVLRSAGIELAGISFDTMLASYLLDAGERNHNLDELSRRYLNHTMIPIKDLIGTGKKQKRMDEVPIAEVGQYAAEDADVPWRLRPLLEGRLADQKLTKLFEEVEIPLIEVLAAMEHQGIRVDVEMLEKLSRRFALLAVGLEEEIHQLAGRTFNIASPKQLAHVLFEDLKLPVVKKTKTGPSTDVDVLEQLAADHPLPAKIVQYRQCTKLKNTYIDALPAMVHPQTGRVHASFHQVVAATGRLSSSDPNLQNIPVRTQQGREIRSAFIPSERGWKLLAADYSQIELRVLAHFSQDEALRESFARDEDVHSRVASEVYGVSLDDVTSEMRRQAKAVNFGVVYGQSPFGLARSLGIEQDAAAQFIDTYFARYPGVEEFLAKTLAECRENGYVTTILGRRRAIRGVRADAGRQRNLPERTAINTVIQGSAADLIKLAMIAIHRGLHSGRHSARMLLQIHDELIFETPVDELDALGRLVADQMEGVLQLRVPIKVDLKSGDNWADCEPWQV